MPPPVVSPYPAGSSYAVYKGFNTGVLEYRQFRAAIDGYVQSKVRWAVFSDAKAAALYAKTGQFPDGVSPLDMSGTALPTPETSPELEAPPASIPSSSQVARPHTLSKSVRLTSSQPSRPPPAPKKALAPTEFDDEGGDTEPEDNDNPFAPKTRSLPGPHPLVKATSVSNALRRGLSSGQVTAPNIIDGPSHVGAGTLNAKLGNSTVPFPVATSAMTPSPAPVVVPDPAPTRAPKRNARPIIQTQSVPASVEIVPAPAPVPASALAPPIPELKVKPRPPHGSYAMCDGCHGTGWKLTPSDNPQSHAPAAPAAPESRAPLATPARPPQAPPVSASAPAPAHTTYKTPGPSVTPAPVQFTTPAKVQRRRRATASESESSTSGLRLTSVGLGGVGPDRRTKTIRSVSDQVVRRDKGKGKETTSDNIIYRPYKYL